MQTNHQQIRRMVEWLLMKRNMGVFFSSISSQVHFLKRNNLCLVTVRQYWRTIFYSFSRCKGKDNKRLQHNSGTKKKNRRKNWKKRNEPIVNTDITDTIHLECIYAVEIKEKEKAKAKANKKMTWDCNLQFIWRTFSN